MRPIASGRPVLDILVPLLLVSSAAQAVGSAENLPEAAPPLDLEVALSGPPPEELSWEALRGRAVVVEFWATWCSPCVGAIPHWNELVEAFAGEPIVFLSVTDEDEARVQRFLEKRPILGAVALDTDRDTFEAYGVEGIPHTLLVDAEGRVQAVTRPEDIETEHLRTLIAGEAPEVEPRTDFEAMLQERLGRSEGAEPLATAMVRPATSDGVMMTGGSGRYIALGFRPGAPISQAHATPRTRVVLDEAVEEFRYDFVFSGFDDAEVMRSVMRSVIAQALDVETRREIRPTDVWVLKRTPGAELALPASEGHAGGARWDPGDLEVANVPLSVLARALESVLGRPVVDETDTSGAFDVDLQWDPDDVESLRAALESLGLTLEEATRELELLVVEPRPEEASP